MGRLRNWLFNRHKPSTQQFALPGPHIRNAEAAYRNGHFIEAITILGAAEPLNGEDLVLLGRSYFELGLRQEAIKAYQRALQLEPELAKTVPELAVLSDGHALSDADADALMPNFSLSVNGKIAVRRFLDNAALNLSTVYDNDNIIVFQRALTFLQDTKFMGGVFKAAESGVGTFSDRTWRVHILIWAARNALNLDGDFVELGTFRGYFASCIVDYLDFEKLARSFFLYDTFAGLPEDAIREKDLPDSFYDALRAHYSQADIYQSVLDRFKSYTNVYPIKGKVPDALYDRCPERISFLHVDLNSARHEIAALEYLWDRIVPGGIIVLDDFGFAIFRAQTEAHQQFFAARGCPIAELPTGQGLVIKSR